MSFLKVIMKRSTKTNIDLCQKICWSDICMQLITKNFSNIFDDKSCI